LAGRGYFDGEEVRECDQAGIMTLVPKPQTSNNQAQGYFDKRDFRYIPKKDEYRCPAGERLIWRFSTIEAGRKLHCYWSSACRTCWLTRQCTPSEQRRVKRWEHEHVLQAMQKRLDCAPEASRVRRQTVEHPFGTLKAWMGSTHFLTRTLPRVNTEMGLHVLAYNFKRMMRMVGVRPLMEAMKARPVELPTRDAPIA
jgi:hypothetical protein